jgi:hypothetical protein
MKGKSTWEIEMLCTMCMHGINVKRMWYCKCGARHCPHMHMCDQCGLTRRSGEKPIEEPK